MSTPTKIVMATVGASALVGGILAANALML
jgi:hypothetical protein